MNENLVPKASKYEPWMCDKIIEVAAQGGHVSTMCQAIGVRSKDTFYRWAKEHKEFAEAYEEARMLSQAFYESILLAGAIGKIKNFNFNAVAMIMNNKFKDEYTRSATGSNTEINIGAINTIENMSSSELDKKIESLQRKLRLIPSKEEQSNETLDISTD
jgi:uridine phosphorylase